MPIPGNLLTTAMAVMPHTDVDQALKTALSMDIPFLPFLCREAKCPWGAIKNELLNSVNGYTVNFDGADRNDLKWHVSWS